MEYKWVKAVVEDYGVDMTAKMIAILKSHGSQTLVNQIDQKVIEDMNLIALEIKMPDWGYYASEGRSPGKFPPFDNLKVWMQQRSIDLSALYPIARKIASMGTKASASHFLNEFKLTKDFEDDVLQAYAKDISDVLVDYVNKVNAQKS